VLNLLNCKWFCLVLRTGFAFYGRWTWTELTVVVMRWMGLFHELGNRCLTFFLFLPPDPCPSWRHKELFLTDFAETSKFKVFSSLPLLEKFFEKCHIAQTIRLWFVETKVKLNINRGCLLSGFHCYFNETYRKGKTHIDWWEIILPSTKKVNFKMLYGEMCMNIFLYSSSHVVYF
jgi:hypothetical protein